MCHSCVSAWTSRAHPDGVAIGCVHTLRHRLPREPWDAPGSRRRRRRRRRRRLSNAKDTRTLTQTGWHGALGASPPLGPGRLPKPPYLDGVTQPPPQLGP
eukprot:1672159-Pyramimonas_sp.AAC.1